MLKIRNVSKVYGSNVGNFNISLNVAESEVYGIVGPNGAGKSTLIRQILGFVSPDEGNVTIDGIDPFINSKKIMGFSGYISGEIALYDGLTGIQYLKTISKIKGNVDWAFVEKLFSFFGLNANKKIKKMSKGMKQKVAIIASVMHKPRFLVLDEPTSGLDVAAAAQFKDLIFRLKKEFKTTIIICSHIFDEIDRVCDRVGFIKDGKLIEEFKIKETSIQVINDRFIEIFKDQRVEDLF